MESDPNDQFPHALTIDIPFPDMRYATIALKALRVDSELSPLVRRNLITISPHKSPQQDYSYPVTQNNILRTEYRAATNRVLRVALNGFMESLSVVIGIMEELDVDFINPTIKASQDALTGQEAGSNDLSENI
ncbi:hypothetical protein OnM2_090003 [Erysiphe neolycopersici]|uniref:Pcc1-domain-containing protein n=1 Tax=Erysiphe neolycopersici TaxID=212602 RepID=A0A420HD17_9PEZI|nr:hypothetical protein OnM2_090003 [Erysiphe neolycopersici]